MKCLFPNAIGAAMLLNSVLAAGAASDGRMELQAGRQFPNLTLPSLEDGRPASISDFRGRKLILHIFASW
jgi:hypothetical protein